MRDQSDLLTQVCLRGLGNHVLVWYVRVQRCWVGDFLVFDAPFYFRDDRVSAVIDNAVDRDFGILVVNLCFFFLVEGYPLRELLLQLLSLLQNERLGVHLIWVWNGVFPLLAF